MGSLTKLKLKPPSPAADAQSPERIALAEAIAAHAENEREYAALYAAAAWDGPACGAVRDAETEFEAAREAVERAKQDAVDTHVATSLGTAAPVAMTIKAARAAVVDAEDTLSAAKSARDALKLRLEEAEKYRHYPAERVTAAAQAVLATSPAIDAVVTDIARLQRELFDMAAQFHWLVRQKMISCERIKTGTYDSEMPLAEIVRSRLNSPPHTWHALAAEVAGARLWEDALSQLMRDAAAPLPTAPA